MITNPVLHREFLTSLRTSRALALALVFLCGLAGLVMLMWPAEGVYSLSAKSSHQLFTLLSLSFLTLVALCAPSFTAASISREKEGETWDLLYDSLLRSDQIVVGKLVAGVGFVLILIVASLPMMGACLILGGVSQTDILQVYGLVTLAGVFFGLLGLWCSATFRSSYKSLIFCYVFILCVCGLTWVPSVILGMWAESVHSIHFVRALSPYAAVLSVVNPGVFAGEHPEAPVGFGALADSFWPFIGFAGGGTLLLFLWALIKVARPPQPKPHKGPTLLGMPDNLGFPFVLIDPRKRRRMIGRLLNVIAVKEMRCKALGRASWMLRAMCGCLIVSFVLAFLPLTQLAKIGIDTIVITCISMPLAIIILISPVLTASAISGERESGVFDMLRVTRVSPRTLLMGKLEVAWFFTLLLVASTCPTFFVLAYVASPPDDMAHISAGVNLIRPFNFQFAAGWEELSQVDTTFLWQMASAFGVMGMAMLLCTIMGVMVSCFSKRSSSATAISYGFVILYAVGTLVPYFIADSLPRWLVDASMTLNPFAAAAKAVATDTFPDLSPQLWLHHLYGVGGLCLLCMAISWWRVWTLMRPSR